jgi:hypothetical protein
VLPFQRFDPFQELVLFADLPLQFDKPCPGVDELGRDGAGGGGEVFLISDAPVRNSLRERAEQLLEAGYFGQGTATTTAAATLPGGSLAGIGACRIVGIAIGLRCPYDAFTRGPVWLKPGASSQKLSPSPRPLLH